MTDIWKQAILKENFDLKAENDGLKTPEQAVETLKQAFKDNDALVAEWHSALACAAIDEGTRHSMGNAIASRFMKDVFNIEVDV